MDTTNNTNNTNNTTTPPTLHVAIQAACDIAAGRVAADPAAAPISIRAAHRDHNCRGRGPEWYRMRWAGSAWTYFAAGRMPAAGMRASERRVTISGDCYPGDLLIQHDRGGPVDAAYIVTGDHPVAGSANGSISNLRPCDVVCRRDGQLAITLPDGSVVLRPNPRRA